MRILSLTFVLVTLTGVACATEPGTSAQGASLTTETCHVVSTNGKLGKFCGSDQKWTELKSTVGFRCQRENTARELCGSADEWKLLAKLEKERRLNAATAAAAARGSGSEATESSMQAHPDQTVTFTPPAPAPQN